MDERVLTADRVEEIMKDCLFRDDEIKDGQPIDPDMMVQVEGIVNNFGLHKERVESHKDEIHAMLKELPDQFHEKKGGGWSFLNACSNRYGEQWTGFHRTMEHLFVLGIAVGKAAWQMKEMSLMMPGGMPYVVVKE